MGGNRLLNLDINCGILHTMKTSLKNAVIASTVMHSVIFLPFYNIAIPALNKEMNKDMVVDYVVVKEPARGEAPRKPSSAGPAEIPKLGSNKNVNVEVKPVEIARQAEVVKNTVIKKRADERIATKETRIKSTKDYAGYYQLIREKIRGRLNENYRDFRREGSVRMTFTLDCYGGLRDLGIDNTSSVSDIELRDIAVRSLREAAPFPAFPKALSLPRMTFNVVVSFKKE
jgi:hypothetical protein